MFQFLNNKILHRKQRQPRGQIAIMMILIIMAFIIFGAVVLNVGKVSEIKTATTIASNASAAMMASLMTGYSEMLYQTQLGGGSDYPARKPRRGKKGGDADDDLTICGFTGVFGTLLTIGIAIILACIPGGQFAVASFVIAMISGGISLALQWTFIQPGITDQYNKLWERFPQNDQFVERGIFTAMQYIVDDRTQAPDQYDLDMDGVAGTQDEVSRFGQFYYKRLADGAKQPFLNPNDVRKFLDELEEFVYDNPFGKPLNPDHPGEADGFGVFDPLPVCGSEGDPNHPCCRADVRQRPPECNPCCLPEGVRPRDCPADGCPLEGDTPWPYVADFYYENYTNAFVSLKEFLGRDDENRYVRVDPNDPAKRYFPETVPEGVYRSTDATGGLYPVLWSLAQRTEFNYEEANIERCFWCDSRVNDPIRDLQCPASEWIHLPSGCPTGLIAECCLPTSNGLRKAFDPVGNANVNSPGCTDANGAWKGTWKRGANRFCSSQWPYEEGCIGIDCTLMCAVRERPGVSECPQRCIDEIKEEEDRPPCIEAGVPLDPRHDFWTGDEVDEIVYGVSGVNPFIRWAVNTLSTANEFYIATRYATWYREEASEWIDPAQGKWAKWRNYFISWKGKLETWVNTEYRGSGTDYICKSGTVPEIIACLDDEIQSLPPARVNERHMMERRRQFLHETYQNVLLAIPKLEKAIAAIDRLHEAVRALNEAWQFVLEHQVLPPKPEQHVIYAWRSPPPYPLPPHGPRRYGPWHLVYVETKLPTKCAPHYNCGRQTRWNRASHEPSFPRIKSFDRKKVRKCFSLGDSFDFYGDGAPNESCNHTDEYDDPIACFPGGTVKSRVVRFDEDKDLTLQFSNKVPIWRFVFHHPEKGPVGENAVLEMESVCGVGRDDSPDDPSETKAFMLNRKDQNEACWNKAVKLLEHGVVTDTCAEYFFHRATPYGFGVKFAKCQGAF